MTRFDTNTTNKYGATQYIKKSEIDKREILEGEQANRDIDDKLIEEAERMEDLKDYSDARDIKEEMERRGVYFDNG